MHYFPNLIFYKSNLCTGDVDQLVVSVPSMITALGLIPSISTNAGACGSLKLCYTWSRCERFSTFRWSLIPSVLEANLGYLRSCLKKMNIKFIMMARQVNTLADRLKDMSLIVGYLGSSDLIFLPFILHKPAQKTSYSSTKTSPLVRETAIPLSPWSLLCLSHLYQISS